MKEKAELEMVQEDGWHPVINLYDYLSEDCFGVYRRDPVPDPVQEGKL